MQSLRVFVCAALLGTALAACDKPEEPVKADTSSKPAATSKPSAAASAKPSATVAESAAPAASSAPVAASASAAPSASAAGSSSAATSAGAASSSAPADDGKSQKTAAQLDPAKWKEQAPATYKAKFATSKGDFMIEVHRDWSPNGADRFFNLVKSGYYNQCRFFRVIDDFMVQFGINGDPAVNKEWRAVQIPDDPPGKQSNKRGMVTFAKTNAPNSRTTQVFINFKDNSNLDPMGFTPFGQVIGDGMKVVDALFKIGEGAPRGPGPDQQRIQDEGNAYLKKDFAKLDWVNEATIVK